MNRFSFSYFFLAIFLFSPSLLWGQVERWTPQKARRLTPGDFEKGKGLGPKVTVYFDTQFVEADRKKLVVTSVKNCTFLLVTSQARKRALTLMDPYIRLYGYLVEKKGKLYFRVHRIEFRKMTAREWKEKKREIEKAVERQMKRWEERRWKKLRKKLEKALEFFHRLGPWKEKVDSLWKRAKKLWNKILRKLK